MTKKILRTIGITLFLLVHALVLFLLGALGPFIGCLLALYLWDRVKFDTKAHAFVFPFKP